MSVIVPFPATETMEIFKIFGSLRDREMCSQLIALTVLLEDQCLDLSTYLG